MFLRKTDSFVGQQEAGEPSVITIDMSTLFIVPALEATQKVEDQINDYLLNTMNNYMKSEGNIRDYYKNRSVTENEIFLPVPLTELDNSNGLYKQY